MIRVEVAGDIDGRIILEKTGREMGRLAEAIASRARQLCPVRTGRLRDSISVRREAALRYVVLAAAPYAGYVEFGTSRSPPKPFMGPALTSVLRYG